MATISMELYGLKCPQPVLRIQAEAPKLNPGDVLEAVADCETFKRDLEKWAERTGKTIIFCNDEGEGKWRAQIQF
jgi:TusA-related sulfurtransferase